MPRVFAARRDSMWLPCLCTVMVLLHARVAASAPQGSGAAAAPARGDGVIRGHVTAEGSDQPLRRARVTCVDLRSRETVRTTSDSAGRFECTRLPAGAYVVSARRTGYVGVDVGASPGHEVALRLVRGGVIEGRITDAYGDPIGDAAVSVRRADAGENVAAASDMHGVTDDLGIFRLWGLREGTYFVTARVGAGPGARDGAAPATFYPGAPMISGAKGVSVEPGREVTGVDFSITPIRLARLSGVVLDAGGRPVAGVRVTVRVRNVDAGAAYVVGEYRTSAAGAFTAPQLPPGTYELSVTVPGTGAVPETGRITASTAGDDVAGITIATASSGEK